VREREREREREKEPIIHVALTIWKHSCPPCTSKESSLKSISNYNCTSAQQETSNYSSTTSRGFLYSITNARDFLSSSTTARDF